MFWSKKVQYSRLKFCEMESKQWGKNGNTQVNCTFCTLLTLFTHYINCQ